MGWKPMWGIEAAIEEAAEFTKAFLLHGDIREEMDREIRLYTNV